MTENNQNSSAAANADGKETVTETTANPSDAGAKPTNEVPPGYVSSEQFTASQQEALRLLNESKAKDAEIERLRQLAESGASNGSNHEAMFPGFEDLGEEEKKNLIEYTSGIENKVKTDLQKDPAIAFARESYNEKRFDEAFDIVAAEFPDLRDSKSDFKSKYFNKSNVPENIRDIMKDLSKVYLFDKAKEIGAKEAREQADRIEIERANGGDKTPTQERSLDDWNRLAIENPAKFAAESKKFDEALASGKLK